jgi:hypothetical protein
METLTRLNIAPNAVTALHRHVQRYPPPPPLPQHQPQQDGGIIMMTSSGNSLSSSSSKMPGGPSNKNGMKEVGDGSHRSTSSQQHHHQHHHHNNHHHDHHHGSVRPEVLERRRIRHAYYQNLKQTATNRERYRSTLQQRSTLPAYARRKYIMDTIMDNPVTIIMGETGCGKSTQCPQFILDDIPTSNIVVTQRT